MFKTIKVNSSNADECLESINKAHFIGLDTETTGLDVYGKDTLFVITISTGDGKVYYFDFRDYNKSANGKGKFEDGSVACKLQAMLLSRDGVVFIHNAKFDLAFLEKCGFLLSKSQVVWCTMSMARVDNNETSLSNFSLASQASKIGLSKDTALDDWMSANNATSYLDVPSEILIPYAAKDADVCLDIGIVQYQRMLTGKYSHASLYKQECDLTRVLYAIEKLGVVLNIDYCNEAIAKGSSAIEKYKSQFKDMTGKDFLKSNKLFELVFADIKDQWVYKDTGNTSFDKNVLEKLKHPVADIIRKISNAKSKLDFYNGFIRFVDDNNILHTSFNSHGARTGRFSSSKPNLQNLKRTDTKESYPVRRAIVPRPNKLFAMIDYKQMEYRLVLDQCNSSLISKVLSGLDVHTAAAEVAGVSRDAAKTVNFLTIYGGGIKKLSNDLGISIEKAKSVQNSIFKANPQMRTYLQKNKRQAESERALRNCMGRYYDFSNTSSHVATNTLIQGGCADIIKKAMVDIHKFLTGKKTRMVLTIHDEIVFEFPRSEKDVIEECAKLMQCAYKHTYLPLDVDIEWSDKSLADKKPWSELA